MSCNQFPKWPNTPYDDLVDDNKRVKTAWRAFFSNISENLIGYFTPDGYVLPTREADYIAALTGDKYIGRIIFNCTDNVAMINNNGTFEPIATETMMLAKLKSKSLEVEP